jgi:hypothetical protein
MNEFPEIGKVTSTKPSCICFNCFSIGNSKHIHISKVTFNPTNKVLASCTTKQDTTQRLDKTVNFSRPVAFFRFSRPIIETYPQFRSTSQSGKRSLIAISTTRWRRIPFLCFQLIDLWCLFSQETNHTHKLWTSSFSQRRFFFFIPGSCTTSRRLYRRSSWFLSYLMLLLLRKWRHLLQSCHRNCRPRALSIKAFRSHGPNAEGAFRSQMARLLQVTTTHVHAMAPDAGGS